MARWVSCFGPHHHFLNASSLFRDDSAMTLRRDVFLGRRMLRIRLAAPAAAESADMVRANPVNCLVDRAADSRQ